jgi:hypothetical protein
MSNRDMIGDFMTKPLQCALFGKFRDQITGVVPAQDPGPGKANMEIDELYTYTDKPTKGKELNLVEERVQYIIWSHLGKRMAPQECVGRSDTNKGRMLKESHMYEKCPT